MSKEKHIEEMLETQCVFYGECEHCPVYPNDKDREDKCRTGCRMLYEAGYRKQSEGEWIERADLQGFICSNGCGELLIELEEDATLPKFCMNCGTKMKNGTTIQEHVETLCKRLCGMKGGGE